MLKIDTRHLYRLVIVQYRQIEEMEANQTRLLTLHKKKAKGFYGIP